MRHRNSGRQLNRDASSRKALFRNLALSLIEHERIQTTLPKAKELRRVAEPLITLAKKDTVANRRLAFNRLRSRGIVSKLFAELGPRFNDRPGGYIRVLKAGFRKSDSAPMAWVILLDSVDESSAPEEKKTKKIEQPAVEKAKKQKPVETVTSEEAAVEAVEENIEETVAADDEQASSESTQAKEKADSESERENTEKK